VLCLPLLPQVGQSNIFRAIAKFFGQKTAAKNF